MDVGSILGPQGGGGSPEMLFGCPEGSWQDGPKRPQEPPRRPIGVLLFFWLIFGRVLVDFCLNLGVLVCWVAGCLVLCLACLLN